MNHSNLISVNTLPDGKYIVKNNHNQKMVKLGRNEYEFLKYIMENEKTKGLSEYKGPLPLTHQQALLEQFTKWELLQENSPQKHRNRFDDITTINLFEFNPNKFLDKYSSLFSILLHPIMLFFYTAIMAVAAYLLFSNPEPVLEMDLSVLHIADYVMIYLLILLTVCLHELAHGMVCKKFGGNVHKMGVMLFYLSPAFFCDVSDIYLFKKKRHKVYVLLAGIITQWVASSTAFIIYFCIAALYQIQLEPLLYFTFANAGISMINLIPFVKLDGYWILVHVSGILNLRKRSFEYLTSLLLRLLRPKQKIGKTFTFNTKKEKYFIVFYGMAAAFFSLLFWFSGLSFVHRLILNVTHPSVALAFIMILAGIIVFNAAKNINQNVLTITRNSI